MEPLATMLTIVYSAEREGVDNFIQPTAFHGTLSGIHVKVLPILKQNYTLLHINMLHTS